MSTVPSVMTQWKELAHLLEEEWHGQAIDRHQACTLAATLLPQFPELRNTLTHIQSRLGRRDQIAH
ncbi:MAG: hypothetical protein K2X44_06995 [Magnetospirillum sp.]|nr:hypothetical protein [Magnetospirillum sp.]